MTTKGIDDIASKYMVEGKCIGYTKIIIIFKGLRRVPKEHLRRIAKSSGATIITTLANDDG
jgi:T-complex protein 1 subunit alpha